LRVRGRGVKRARTKRKAVRGAARKRKVAPRLGAKKAAKRARARRRPVRKSTKRAVRRAKKTVKRPRAKIRVRRTGVRRSGRRAELKVVLAEKPAKPRAKKAGTKPQPPFAGALENASAKDLAIFDLVRARVEVQAAIQGLQSGSAEQPVDAGKWSPREI